MNKKILLFTFAFLTLIACQSKESVSLSSDEDKMSYMFGFQLAKQVFSLIPLQVGQGLSEDAVLQAFEDALAKDSDSTKKLQLADSDLQEIGKFYAKKAEERFNKAKPDSMTQANQNPLATRTYIDSVLKTLPVEAEVPVTGKPVTVTKESKDIEKFSYMFGINIAGQFKALGTQSDLKFSKDNFVLGIKDGHKAAKDSSFQGNFTADTLKALETRYTEKVNAKREKLIAEAKKEEEKLKQEIAPLRGDTLEDGRPAKMNFKVKMEGINVSAEDLQAYAGKTLLIFYFSPTCGHCMHAAPEVEKLAMEFKEKGLTSIAIASSGHPKKNIREFMENTKMELTVLQDAGRQFGELYSDGYVPKIYLVSPDASYKLYKSFEKEKEQLKTDIAELLKK